MMLTLFKLFYQQVNNKWEKHISLDLMYYLDDIALAYWAMDDGAYTPSGFYLHTKGFTFNESYMLAGLLHYQFGLICTVQNHDGMPVVYITSQSLPTFIALIKPHFHTQMLYKLAE